MSRVSSFISCSPIRNRSQLQPINTTLIVSILPKRIRIAFFNYTKTFYTKVNEKEKQTLDKMQSAKLKIRNEIRELKDRLKLAQENMQIIKEKVEAEELASTIGIIDL